MAVLTPSQACYRCTVASWRKRHPERPVTSLKGLVMYNAVFGSAFTCNAIQETHDPNTGEPYLLLGTWVYLEKGNPGEDKLKPCGPDGPDVAVAWFDSEKTYLLFGWPDPETPEFGSEND